MSKNNKENLLPKKTPKRRITQFVRYIYQSIRGFFCLSWQGKAEFLYEAIIKSIIGLFIILVIFAILSALASCTTIKQSELENQRQNVNCAHVYDFEGEKTPIIMCVGKDGYLYKVN